MTFEEVIQKLYLYAHDETYRVQRKHDEMIIEKNHADYRLQFTHDPMLSTELVKYAPSDAHLLAFEENTEIGDHRGKSMMIHVTFQGNDWVLCFLTDTLPEGYMVLYVQKYEDNRFSEGTLYEDDEHYTWMYPIVEGLKIELAKQPAYRLYFLMKNVEIDIE